MYSAALRERGKNTHSTELSSTELEVSSRLHAYVKKDLDFIVSYFAVRDQSLTVTGGHLGFRCSCHFEEEYLPKEWWSRTETTPCYSQHLITAILRRIRTCTRFKKEKEKKKENLMQAKELSCFTQAASYFPEEECRLSFPVFCAGLHPDPKESLWQLKP